MIHLFFHNKLTVVLIGALVLSSCQKVIEVEIDEDDQVYVFEGVLKDRDSTSFFKVSKTVNIYENATHEIVSGAVITVQDENSVSYSFSEDPADPGTYINNNFAAVENMTYYLTANVEGHIITSSSFSKQKPILDSIYARPNQLDQNTPQSKWIFYHSTDRVEEENYYRLRIWINGKEPSQYFIGNDYYINGETYEAQFFTADAYPGDKIDVEMLEMDPKVYDYLYGLQNTLTTGPFSPAPANPPSNLECDIEVQGYFGVYMTQTASMIVQ
ncbi:MAG: DUF4249 domain-containing protein [Crocinitomicaceae bacterium]|nr:DUF4249 domain-containing protein [Crocinitomicaceae bacterium]